MYWYIYYSRLSSNCCESSRNKGYGCCTIPKISWKHSLWMWSWEYLSVQPKIERDEVYDHNLISFAFSTLIIEV